MWGTCAKLLCITLWAAALSIVFPGFQSRSLAAESSTEVIETLSAFPGYYSVATPEQIRAKLRGISLAGVAVTEPVLGDEPIQITPLMRAAKETPHGEVIDILVKAGCDVNAATGPIPIPKGTPQLYGLRDTGPRMPLHFAVLNPNPAALKALLKYKPDLEALSGQRSNYTALELAAGRSGRATHFTALLEAGAKAVIPRSITSKRDEYTPENHIWSLFLGRRTRSDSDSTPIPKVRPEDAAIMTAALLKAGYKPGPRALSAALSAGQNEAARSLLRAGVSPRYMNEEGLNMLQAALERPRLDTLHPYTFPVADPAIIADLALHIDVNAGRDEEKTPLVLAAKAGMDAPVFKALVDAGAKPGDDNDLLLYFLQGPCDKPEVLTYLLSLGFSPSVEGKQRGLTPLEATSRAPEKPKCALALVKAGADPSDLSGLDRRFAVKAGILDPEGARLVTASTVGKDPLDTALAATGAATNMPAARKDPREAVVDARFYHTATPDQVREIVGKQSLSGIRSRTERVSLRGGPGLSSEAALILALILAPRETITGKRTVTYKFTPLTIAARVTPYPEVIDILVNAGCNVNDLDSQALRSVVYNKNPKVLEAVLRYKPDLNIRMPGGGSPLHELAMSERTTTEHLRIFLAAKPDLNVQSTKDIMYINEGETVLMRAIYWRKADRVRMLLAAGANPNLGNRRGSRPLDVAIEAGEYTLAKELIAAGAELNYKGDRRTPLAAAARKKRIDPELLRRLLAAYGPKSEEAQAALNEAAEDGSVEGLRNLLAGGVTPTTGEQSALCRAVRRYYVNGEGISLLLAKGADPEQICYGGSTPLILAISSGPENVTALIEGGAKANGTDKAGNTALLHAVSGRPEGDDAERERLGVIQALIAAKADVNARSKPQGWSVLQCALQNPEALRLLLKAGARVNDIAGDGETPLTKAVTSWEYTRNHAKQYVAYWNFDGAVPVLLAGGANPRQPNAGGTLPLALARSQKSGAAVAYLERALQSPKK